jgi:allophanate hydrolase
MVATGNATAVARLRQAGAVIIGKTYLDQFATGLVEVPRPMPWPRLPARSNSLMVRASLGGSCPPPFGQGPDDPEESFELHLVVMYQ